MPESFPIGIALAAMRCLVPAGLAMVVLGLSGCLYSTQHFNNGLLLPAGESRVTLGGGRQVLWRCADYQNDSATGRRPCNQDQTGREKVEQSQIFKGSLDYRLGLKNEWKGFPGFEMQWHLEAPTNPLTMEFALQLGMPGPDVLRHALGAGWGTGAWAGNTFFLEYAVSLAHGRPKPFANFRLSYLATQIGDVLDGDFSKPLPYDPRWVAQGGIGFFYRFPDWTLFPDFIIPNLHLTWPQVPPGGQKFSREDISFLQWDIQLGMGWDI